MRIIDYLQGEIREIKNIKQLNNGEFELTYNNEIVKRKKYEFREVDNVYKCIKGFSVEACDGDGGTIENEYMCINENSLWVYPEDKDYKLVGGDVRLDNEENGWIEISKEHLEEYFIEV